jgi:hypothetical protein
MCEITVTVPRSPKRDFHHQNRSEDEQYVLKKNAASPTVNTLPRNVSEALSPCLGCVNGERKWIRKFFYFISDLGAER